MNKKGNKLFALLLQTFINYVKFLVVKSENFHMVTTGQQHVV